MEPPVNRAANDRAILHHRIIDGCMSRYPAPGRRFPTSENIVEARGGPLKPAETSGDQRRPVESDGKRPGIQLRPGLRRLIAISRFDDSMMLFPPNMATLTIVVSRDAANDTKMARADCDNAAADESDERTHHQCSSENIIKASFGHFMAPIAN